MPEPEQAASWHAVTQDGAVHSGGAAFAPVFDRLPGGGPLAALGRRFPGGLERGYRWVAGHRSLVGKLVPGAARGWAEKVLRGSGCAPSGR